MTPWYEGPLAALALRTGRSDPQPGAAGGPDPERDRVCAAAVAVQQAPDAPVEMHSPPDAPGLPARRLAGRVARSLASHAAGRPLVVMDAPYDLTLLDRELRRHGNAPLAGSLGGRSMCVLDPVLLDIRLDHDAAAGGGCRGLARLCGRYGLSAPADTVQDEAAAGLALARALGRHFAPQLAGLTPATLLTLQAIWFGAEAGRRGAWFTTGTRRPADHIWPLRPLTPA
ncbi:3'-5' exonuclease family protein [Streptomyces winkii]|uniref:3'-5' exonuclease n=1 Tax=Streptomyces winkii TaxID=3051178 RepID=UPI0028D67FD5|nr:3'-5' exonuclease [Streptomyces sp. DSM 40971]